MVDRNDAEARFADVFSHLGLLVAYARRRGAPDPDAIAAEAMSIAWRKLADVPRDDPRPWLVATTRNLLYADHRRRADSMHVELDGVELAAPEVPLSPELDLDPELSVALGDLAASDREALLLVAWDDLTPTQAAASLGISPVAFRVRLHRARKRLRARLPDPEPAGPAEINVDPHPSPKAEWRHS